MECPNCHDELVEAQPRAFETLVEHVTDPNAFMYREPPLRRTWECPNRCYRYAYWNDGGEAYRDIPRWAHWVWENITNYEWPHFASPPETGRAAEIDAEIKRLRGSEATAPNHI